MFAASENLKALYQADSTDKYLILDFYRDKEAFPFLHIFGENIMSETMELNESLSSGENLDFGCCEASQIKVTLIDIPDTIKGTTMTACQVVDGLSPGNDLFPENNAFPSGHIMPLGSYVVQTAEKRENRRYLDVVALDFMSKFDIDVSEWYSGLSFPLSLRDFRASLCQYVGVREHVPDYLPNDDMPVEKTVDAASLTGRQVLIACEQVNGVFGHFDRAGVLQHVALWPNDRLVPAGDLFPGGDLFPMAPGGMNEQAFDEQLDPYLLISCEFEEYTVRPIDKVQIRQEEGDIGALFGDGTNAYTVEGNFLLYGKNAAELQDVAVGIYGMVAGRLYIPYESESKGLPYIEVGDAVRFSFGEESIISYVMQRTLKGIYALRDTYSATGEEIRSVQKDINAEIIQLQGKATFLVKNVDEVSARVIDLKKNVEAQFKITAEAIESTVKRLGQAESSIRQTAESLESTVKRLGQAESSIRQTAEQISLKVSKGDVSAQLSMEAGNVRIVGDRFSWQSTYSSMTADGKLSCVDGTFGGKITASEGRIGGFEIDRDSLVKRSGVDASIDFGAVMIDQDGLTTENWWVSNDEISSMNHIMMNIYGDVFVFNSDYYDGFTVADALDDLRRRIGGGSCSRDCSDYCDDWCDDYGCDIDDLIDDIGAGCS